jgi:hypothetical protein
MCATLMCYLALIPSYVRHQRAQPDILQLPTPPINIIGAWTIPGEPFMPDIHVRHQPSVVGFHVLPQWHSQCHSMDFCLDGILGAERVQCTFIGNVEVCPKYTTF